MERSVDGLTVVFTGPVLLLPVIESVWSPLTTALLLIVPAVVGLTTIEIVALAAFPRLPRLQITMAPDGGKQLPWLGVEDTWVTVAGKVSVIVTPVAVPGPLLVTVIV
jgi:hypothetical protein